MIRRLLATLTVVALGLALVARADDPAKTKADPKAKAAAKDENAVDPKVAKEEAAIKQQQLAAQYREFEAALLRLAQRLAESSRPEDRDKAVILKKAIAVAATEGVSTKFDRLIKELRDKKDLNLQELKQAQTANQDLAADIRAILTILMTDNRDAELRKQINELQEMLKKLNQVIRDQQTVRAWTDRATMEKDRLEREQRQVRASTEDLIKGQGKPGENKETKGDPKGQGKPGETKEGSKPGEAKNDTKEAKGGERNQEGKPGETPENKEGKPGEAKEGKPGENKEGKPGEAKEGKPGENKEAKPGEAKEGKPGENKEAKPGENKEGKPGEGSKEAKPGEGKPSPSQQGGKPSESKEGKPGEAKSGGKPEGAQENKPGESKEAGKPSENKENKPGEAKEPGKQDKPEKPGEAKKEKPGENKGKQDNKGQAKGQQSPSGEQKPPQQGQQGEGKPSQGQPQQQQQASGKGDPQQQQQQQQQQQNNQQQQAQDPAKKKIQEGIEGQKESEDLVKKAELPKAADKQNQVIKDLQEAAKKLEELLKQLRQEEIERILAALQARCEQMLAMQIAVRDGTVDVFKTVDKLSGQKATQTEVHKSNGLSDDEDKIVLLANKAVELLKNEGSAVAFPEVFMQIRDDMVTVSNRLRKTDVGLVTQTIENDIIETLKEMIDALKKARQENQQQQQKPPSQQQQQQQQGDQKLIELLHELKMIRSMQVRVNDRTKLYGKEYSGEQAPAASQVPTPQEREKAEMIQKELKGLSDRQNKIFEVTNNIARGKNK